MDPRLLVLLLTAPPGADTLPPFADAATRAVVAHAMARQASQDTLVSDYSAQLHNRMTIAFGHRRWARIPAFAVDEQDATVRWERPNDIQVQVLGERSKSRWPDADISGGFDRPWFVPRALGDSIRLLGSDFPERAALHPFAPDGPAWYRYTLVDSTRIRDPRGRTITLLGVDVVPRREGLALVAGEIWVDEGTWDVVRFSFRFVGTGLWSAPHGTTHKDSTDAERDNRTANRILSVDADLEYALEDGKYWMPFRQTLSGQVLIPFLDDLVVPFSVTTSFDGYELNRGVQMAFTLPLDDSVPADSARPDSAARGRRSHRMDDSLGGRAYAGHLEGGGRYEVRIPPMDTLARYAGWTDSLVMDEAGDDRADLRQIEGRLAAMSESLPRSMTGSRGAGFALEHLADAFRYDRAEGLALGFGWRTPVPGLAFTSIYGAAHYGLSDDRITGRADLVREAPGGRWTLTAYHDVRPVDAVFAPKLLGNSVNALFTAHDDADWVLAEGGALRYETSVGLGGELELQGGLEHEASVATTARSAVNDFLGGSGEFQPNPPVAEGTFVTAEAMVTMHRGAGHWMAGTDLRSGRAGTSARLFGEWGSPLWGATWAPALTLRGGVASGGPLPQSGFRIGGPWSARGYTYGVAAGAAFWSAQLDAPVTRGPVRPVVFVDAAQAGTVGRVLTGRVFADAGVGLSILGGAERFDLSQPITPDGRGPRFDIVFGGPR